MGEYGLVNHGHIENRQPIQHWAKGECKKIRRQQKGKKQPDRHWVGARRTLHWASDITSGSPANNSHRNTSALHRSRFTSPLAHEKSGFVPNYSGDCRRPHTS
ncbi:hypothetical protein Zmor_012364 [Zophobas morio]|uniref:Uncharacterized protein n=1 Tax=Zophobas morio TaxID=2755281 RepID=A0AA38LY66_9CUCU|nr:hypothetical protein Zmor_012364 [Zophobas morio]